MIFLIFYLGVMIFGALAYFKLATRFGIIDKPNERSSHNTAVVRGGGIIFVLGVLLWFLESSFSLPFFVVGVILIATISFLDDIRPQGIVIRFVIQFLSLALLFYETGLFEFNLVLILLSLIVCIGILNAFNFMDGINGITGVYAIVMFSTFLFIDLTIINFVDELLLISLLISTLVFLFFNFRKTARCFAGDVGSVTLAFIHLYLLFQLILISGSFWWGALFLIFGIDSAMTVLFRLLRKENIFKAHRLHLYQLMANEMWWDHRIVSLVYGVIQLLLNIFLIYLWRQDRTHLIIIPAVFILMIYIFLRNSSVKRFLHSKS